MGIFVLMTTRILLHYTMFTVQSRPDPSVYVAALSNPSTSSAVLADQLSLRRLRPPDQRLIIDLIDYKVYKQPLNGWKQHFAEAAHCARKVDIRD